LPVVTPATAIGVATAPLNTPVLVTPALLDVQVAVYFVIGDPLFDAGAT
jgi:hypothetical protein